MRAAVYKRGAAGTGLAMSHRRAAGKRLSFGLWAAKSSKAVRRSGVLFLLLQRRSYATRLAIFTAWIGLVNRSRSLYDLNERVGQRMLSTVLEGWRKAVVRAIELEQTVDEMEEAALARRAIAAITVWSSRASADGVRRSNLMESVAARKERKEAVAMLRLKSTRGVPSARRSSPSAIVQRC